MSIEWSGVSLFASGGIGDLALNAAGVQVLVANELISERADLFARNFPETEMMCGDIWGLQDKIIARTLEILNGRHLDVLLATPPCQGMSKNGRGKLLNMIRHHGKPKFDKRNELIIPTMNIACSLKPRIVVMENVPEMANTVIPVDGNEEELVSILDYVGKRLGNDYIGDWKAVEFANYGVPQRRQRLITIFTRDEQLKRLYRKRGTLFPRETHSERGEGSTKRWVSVRDTISHLPHLDAQSKESAVSKTCPYHEISLLDERKYFWVTNTPVERSAFDNQCANPECLYTGNPTHGAYRNDAGVNKAKEDTPIFCVKCGELLPRPVVGEGNEVRLMKGFTSAYKRMSWDAPSSTLTTNFAYACSDNKLHPDQHRTLSTLEALMLHTITDFEYHWEHSDHTRISRGVIRDVIGESVPPRGFKVIFDHLLMHTSEANLKSIDEEMEHGEQMMLSI